MQWSLALLTGSACVLALLLCRGLEHSSGAEAAAVRDLAWRGIPPAFLQAARPRYPYSVVAGGVRNRDEVLRAVAADRVVQAHYAGIEMRRLQLVRLGNARMAFVSYRKNGRVFWTRRKVGLKAGEEVLTDGEHMLRARCGNRISEVAMQPTSHKEPVRKELDSPEVTPARLLIGPIAPQEPGLFVESPQHTDSDAPHAWFTPLITGPAGVEGPSPCDGRACPSGPGEAADPGPALWFAPAAGASAIVPQPVKQAAPVTPEPGVCLLLVTAAFAMAMRMRLP